MVYQETPLCSWGSAFGCESAELLPACLINLLPESFGAQSLSEPSYNSKTLLDEGTMSPEGAIAECAEEEPVCGHLPHGRNHRNIKAKKAEHRDPGCRFSVSDCCWNMLLAYDSAGSHAWTVFPPPKFCSPLIMIKLVLLSTLYS
jgi:hypothetical protein